MYLPLHKKTFTLASSSAGTLEQEDKRVLIIITACLYLLTPIDFDQRSASFLLLATEQDSSQLTQVIVGTQLFLVLFYSCSVTKRFSTISGFLI